LLFIILLHEFEKVTTSIHNYLNPDLFILEYGPVWYHLTVLLFTCILLCTGAYCCHALQIIVYNFDHIILTEIATGYNICGGSRNARRWMHMLGVAS
jgi:hypothetical protein